MRKVALVTAMWVLGLAAVAGFAWLVARLDGTPVRVPPDAPVPAPAPADQPLAAVASGVARSAGTAGAELADGDRGRATHATDAALRAAEVGHAASHGAVKTAFAGALHDIHLARERLHGGDAERAGDALERAVDRLAGVVDAARGLSPGVPPEAVWTGYRGAKLVNANGSTIGRVTSLGGGRGEPAARLRLGGAPDVLGVVDLGGRRATVPADRLLWGRRRSIGSVFVVLPTHRSDPRAALHAVAGARARSAP